jgi:hypothetical protein
MERFVYERRGGEGYLEDVIQPGEGASVFISYSRVNLGFVKDLKDNLEVDGRRVWVDMEDEPPADDWFSKIQQAIEETDAFIYVLSPDSIQSEVCGMEIEHAVRNGKRIVPVVCEDVDYKEVRQEISDLNWIFFREDGDDFRRSMGHLVKALDDDLEHARFHTKLLTRALYWEQHDFEKSTLLRGKDLDRAQTWLSASALGKEPKPTTLHMAFISASASLNETMTRRRRVALFFVFIALIGIIWPSWGVFFFALIFSHFFIFLSSR